MFIIPARLASTRFPRKILADIGGVPMFVRTAQNAARAGEVAVACDDTAVAEVARAHGLRAVLTAASHESGTERICEAAGALGLGADELVINVQADEPFFEVANLRAFAAFARREICERGAFMASCYKPVAAAHAADPNLVKVVLGSECGADNAAVDGGDGTDGAENFAENPAENPAQNSAQNPAQNSARNPARNLPNSNLPHAASKNGATAPTANSAETNGKNPAATTSNSNLPHAATNCAAQNPAQSAQVQTPAPFAPAHNPAHNHAQIPAPFALYFSRSLIPYPRSACETYFAHIGIYAYSVRNLREFCALRTRFLEQTEKLEQLRALAAGKKIAMLEIATESIGIDTPDDFARAREVFGF